MIKPGKELSDMMKDARKKYVTVTKDENKDISISTIISWIIIVTGINYAIFEWLSILNGVN